ncbi:MULTISPECIES: type I restriction enzyme endonuclease domain-containing protein [unclassified Thiocapsa]|uniref:type I restriction enzyme endonuclease domain-containing protein n=2 Tax=unclassified Thiocapsa TaxID=2641286 RepID=UPI0035B30DD5
MRWPPTAAPAAPGRPCDRCRTRRYRRCSRPSRSCAISSTAAMIRKRLADDSNGPKSRARQRDIDAAVRQVIGGAVDADEVIDLFAVVGLDEARLDILSDEFLERVAALEQKNLALETLRKLLNDQIRSTERSNLVRSRKFREALEDALLRYTNKAITTAEMIARLIDLARDLPEAQRQRQVELSTEDFVE